MVTSSWLDDVRRELVNRQVGTAYRERLLEELRDHLDDLRCEERNDAMSAEVWNNRGTISQRMGEPAAIAAAADRPRVPVRFAQRHPLITFLVTPVPLLIVLWIAYGAGTIGVLSGFQAYRGDAWAIRLATLVVHGAAYVPAIVLTSAIAWLAVRSHAKTGWWLTAAGLVALVSSMVVVTLNITPTPGTGTLQFGLGFPPMLNHWPQLAIPLALTALFLLYARRRGYRDPIAPSVGLGD
jgi:hypothetical protein